MTERVRPDRKRAFRPERSHRVFASGVCANREGEAIHGLAVSGGVRTMSRCTYLTYRDDIWGSRHCQATANEASASASLQAPAQWSELLGPHGRLHFLGDSIAGQLYASFICNQLRASAPRSQLDPMQSASFTWMPYLNLSHLRSTLHSSVKHHAHTGRIVWVVHLGGWYGGKVHGAYHHYERDAPMLARSLATFTSSSDAGGAREAILLSPSPQHWYGGGPFSEAALSSCMWRTQAVERMVLQPACEESSAGAFNSRQTMLEHISQAAVTNASGMAAARVRWLNFSSIAKAPSDWQHPGYARVYDRATNRTATCDCTHWCYKPVQWDHLFAALAHVVRQPAR